MEQQQYLLSVVYIFLSFILLAFLIKHGLQGFEEFKNLQNKWTEVMIVK